MSGFLYYVSGVQMVDSGDLLKYGLDRLIDTPACNRVNSGPDGKSGCIVADANGGHSNINFSRTQVWQEMAMDGPSPPSVWVGFAHLPTQSDLLRRHSLETTPVKMQNGESWDLAKLREYKTNPNGQPAYVTRLPKVWKLDPDTKQLAPNAIDPLYESVWEMSWELSGNLSPFLVGLMSLTHRVAVNEVSLLGLISDSVINEVLDKCLDMKSYREIVKNQQGRSESVTTDSPSGAERPTQEEQTRTVTVQQ